MNRDGIVDFLDVEVIAGDWLLGQADCPGDINTDSIVDFRDYAILADTWLE